MPIAELIIIGLALSMDAFAVTLSNSVAGYANQRWQALAMPIAFGLFQGLMPLVGYFLGSFAAQLIADYAGIIALAILAIIGGKMIFEGINSLRRQSQIKQPSEPVKFSIPALLAQSVATSIDALIVGVSFLAMGTNIWAASSIVAVTTFACCLVALAIGRRFGSLLGDKAQIVGGVVLVLIGVKSLF